VRAYWDGSNFYSRQGNPFPVPAWFKEGLPADTALDGELWCGRQKFRQALSVIKNTGSGKQWEYGVWCDAAPPPPPFLALDMSHLPPYNTLYPSACFSACENVSLQMSFPLHSTLLLTLAVCVAVTYLVFDAPECRGDAYEARVAHVASLVQFKVNEPRLGLLDPFGFEPLGFETSREGANAKRKPEKMLTVNHEASSVCLLFFLPCSSFGSHLGAGQVTTPWAKAVGVQQCTGLSHLQDELEAVEAKGGEGLMLRQPQSLYAHGARSGTLLKVGDASAKIEKADVRLFFLKNL
jgi:hypothetical protein